MEWEESRPLRGRSGCDEDDIAVQEQRLFGVSFHSNGVGINERAYTGVRVGAVPVQVLGYRFAFRQRDAAFVHEKVWHGGPTTHGQVHAKQLPGPESG
jgi:hypothetical protein